MSRPNPPLSPETLDELLSADLDGEFERAAAELGFTPEAARAALAASPDVAARRAALAQARDLLAAQPLALEPDAEARLVAAALSRADDHAAAPQRVNRMPTHRLRGARRALVGIGTAAAVIAGVVALSANNPAGQSKSSNAASSAGTPAPAHITPNNASRSVAFGAVTPPDAFRRKVQDEIARLPHEPSATSADKSAQSPTVNAPSLAAPRPAYGVTNGTTTQNAAAGGGLAAFRRLGCIAVLERTGRVPSAPVLSGSGTKNTQPVFVVVYRQAGSYVVYILSAADCSVVSRTALP
jgi:hypothetical protein